MKWNQLVDTFGQLRRCVFADLQKSCLYPNHLRAFYSEAILLLFLFSLTGWQFCCDCRAAVCLTNPGRLTDRQWERNARDYSYILDLSPSTVQKGCEQRTVLRLLSLTDPSSPPLQARARIWFCSICFCIIAQVRLRKDLSCNWERDQKTTYETQFSYLDVNCLAAVLAIQI